MSIDIEKECELIEAAEAVIARWYTPKWKDELHTATFITRLCTAVERASSTPQAPTPEVAAPLPRQAAVQGDWISVADRLPSVGQHVLAFRPTAHITQDPPICITFYRGQMKRDWQDVEHGFDCLCHPSHWMQIPTAPQIEKDAK